MLLLVDFLHLGDEVRGDSVTEFLNGVHPGGLKKLGELRANTLDAEQIRVVHPHENQLAGDSGLLFKFLASLGCFSSLKKLIDSVDSGCGEFLRIDRADALDVNNFVNHNLSVKNSCPKLSYPRPYPHSHEFSNLAKKSNCHNGINPHDKGFQSLLDFTSQLSKFAARRPRVRQGERTMQSGIQYEEVEWFAMRVTYHRELEAKRLLDERGVENFIPMKYEKSVRTGRKHLVPVIHNIIFVRTTASRIQELKKPTCVPLLQYMMDQRLGKKITVPEKQMRQFIAVTGTYDETLRFFGPSEINFTKAQKVRITGGMFEGCEGVFVKVKGSRAKKVVIEIQGIVAVALVSVHPDLVVPIE